MPKTRRLRQRVSFDRDVASSIQYGRPPMPYSHALCPCTRAGSPHPIYRSANTRRRKRPLNGSGTLDGELECCLLCRVDQQNEHLRKCARRAASSAITLCSGGRDKGTHFDDAIAMNAFPRDLHLPDGRGIETHSDSDTPDSLSLAFCPRTSTASRREALRVASREALAAIRQTAPAMAMGHTARSAAGLCVKLPERIEQIALKAISRKRVVPDLLAATPARRRRLLGIGRWRSIISNAATDRRSNCGRSSGVI